MTDIINGDIYRYFSIEEALIEASHITNLKTGERVELPNDAKNLYSRMRKRYHFFTASSTGGNKGTYYDNIEELADILTVERTDSLCEDQKLAEEVTQLALSLAACKDELSDLLQN